MIKISNDLIQLLPFTKIAGRPGTGKKATIARDGFFSNVVLNKQVFSHSEFLNTSVSDADFRDCTPCGIS